MGRVVILLLFSCTLFKSEVRENPTPPDLKPIIDKVERSGDGDIKKELKKETLIALKSCQEYAEQSNKRFDLLEAEIKGLKAEISSKDLKIKELEEELSTWRTIKFWSYFVVISIVVLFFLRALWKNRIIIMRLLGVPVV